MSWESYLRLYDSLDVQCSKHETVGQCWLDVQKSAARYAGLRIKWYLADQDERRSIDEERTMAHDAFIDSCNILSRAMNTAGLNNAWRKELGTDRKRVGDFACYVAAIMSIKAR